MDGQILGVYNIKPIKNKSCIKIDHGSNIKASEKIKDNMKLQVSLDKPAGIYGGVYIANILSTYLQRSKKQPVMYLNVFYSKTLKAASLYNITLYFTITDEVETEKDLYTKELNGFYTLELTNVTTNEVTVLDDKISKYKGEELMIIKMVDLAKTSKMLNIFKELARSEEKKIVSKYQKEYDNCEIPVVTYDKEKLFEEVLDYY